MTSARPTGRGRRKTRRARRCGGGRKPGMRDIGITEFRRQCLTLLEDLPEEGVVITKRGRPIARVVPMRPRRKSERVTLPLLRGKGRPGPLCPSTETPYDLVLD